MQVKAWHLFGIFFAMAGFVGTAHAQADTCSDYPGLRIVRGSHLDQVNAIRARQTVGKLVSNGTLDEIAQLYACLLAQTGHFDHVGPDGSTLSERVSLGGYRYCFVAENLARGYPTVDAAIRGWVTSEGHWKNLKHSAAQEIGLGAAYAGDAPAPTRDGPRSLGDLATSLDGKPRLNVAVIDRRSVVWVQVLGAPC